MERILIFINKQIKEKNNWQFGYLPKRGWGTKLKFRGHRWGTGMVGAPAWLGYGWGTGLGTWAKVGAWLGQARVGQLKVGARLGQGWGKVGARAS